MIINVSEILKNYGEKIAVDGVIERENAEFLGERFVFIKPLTVKGIIINNGKTLKLNADVSAVVKTRCARCGCDIELPVEFCADEAFGQGGAVSEDEDITSFEGNEIIPDDIILNAFFMNIPTKSLCDENCKGLCLICGKNLNDGACGCEAEQDIDPRWAALAKIKNNMPDE
jgi:uncharacterized protein